MRTIFWKQGCSCGPRSELEIWPLFFIVTNRHWSLSKTSRIADICQKNLSNKTALCCLSWEFSVKNNNKPNNILYCWDSWVFESFSFRQFFIDIFKNLRKFWLIGLLGFSSWWWWKNNHHIFNAERGCSRNPVWKWLIFLLLMDYVRILIFPRRILPINICSFFIF